jgi:hypothetical protein
MKEGLEMRGRLVLVGSDAAGRELWRRAAPNRIVTSGRDLVAHMFAGVSSGTPPAPVSTFAVGTGSAAPADGDVALGAQRGGRKPISSVGYATITDTSTGAPVARVQVSLTSVFDFGEANDPAVPLTEAAIFNADGVMYNRVVFEPVTKTDTFKLTLQWDVVF